MNNSNFNRIDVLFNSAYDWVSLIWTRNLVIGDALWTQFFGSLNTSCIPYMKTQNNGSIVMITTMAEHKPMLMNGGYAASNQRAFSN